ncbi:TPA: hypothetical protein DCY43_01530 [candidate division WWE3 bacterium]|uniref:Nucleotidyl transferase AbiEii/AbiGii toxin family protein n=3 Tax=Katanobacteria TaxID=422282 RepID=A0A0G1KD01_UNCKA|nr:MAG: hypothetical protein UW36_C0002G0046 [candidate division WWE3 bacterium GW2011_GWA2_44_16]OGC51318.1 MAG: hypothetical protein A2709_01270 [candidate division WWE3 bacterium RIFCSPHIGHO2_01_FULL_43_9]HAZ29419.1 hypothetical protein [candidate division WWE3 bacterium]
MLSQDELTKIATKMQTSKDNTYREYAQNLFLNRFYENELARHIFFKGGTALRLLYRSPRFSEDLDFSSNLQLLKGIEQVVEDTLIKLEVSNISAGVLESKETENGYIGVFSVDVWGQSIRVKLEISYREKASHGSIRTVNGPYNPPYPVWGLDQKTMVDQKVAALMTRHKPRDFYDIYFLLRSDMLTSENKNIIKEIHSLTQKTTIDFEKELRVFLPKNHWMMIEDFKSILLEELKRYI